MAGIHTEQDMIDFYAAFSRSDFEHMRACLHPECVLQFPGATFGGQTVGRDAIIEKFTGIQAVMGGTLQFHCKWAVCHAGQAVVHWFTTGKPTTGGRYMNRGVAWFKLRDGLVIEFQDFLDTEIVSAFWPGEQPAADLGPAEDLVKKLFSIATPEALAAFERL